MLDWTSLIREHVDWEAYNFPKVGIFDQLMGIQEEIGELTHHYLKMKQDIRNNEDHINEMKDAVGDATIYLLGAMHSLSIDKPYEIKILNKEEPDKLILLIGCMGAHLNGSVLTEHGTSTLYAVTKLVHGLKRWCFVFGWDYEQIVTETWAKVKQRDWTKNRDTGVSPTSAIALLQEMDDGPLARCNSCKRGTWETGEKNQPCGMRQPDDSVCQGTMVPL